MPPRKHSRRNVRAVPYETKARDRGSSPCQGGDAEAEVTTSPPSEQPERKHTCRPQREREYASPDDGKGPSTTPRSSRWCFEGCIWYATYLGALYRAVDDDIMEHESPFETPKRRVEEYLQAQEQIMREYDFEEDGFERVTYDNFASPFEITSSSAVEVAERVKWLREVFQGDYAITDAQVLVAMSDIESREQSTSVPLSCVSPPSE
jgi:hypothetical protein